MIPHMRFTAIFFITVFIVPLFFVVAQESFNHPELEWYTIETENFLVHYHNGTERTAREVATIAEYIHPTITSLYNHKPDQKVTFVIRDHDDYSNGASYFYDNKIEIWAPSLDFQFRGVHPWLWNVVTHEYTHLIQIQTLMKFGRKVPSLYLQWLDYEKERRPDVLYGYPNILVSYPISGFVLPSWFAEGVAQYNSPDYNFDYWDSHRDMILRTAILNKTVLTWDEMGVFGKNSLGNESAYNAGFSLVQYIAEKYGVETLEKISRELSKLHRLTIDEALKKVINKSGVELYNEWINYKETHYRNFIDSLGANDKVGRIIEDEGFGNFYPLFTPDKKGIVYISNKGTDYLSTTSVYYYDVNTGKKKLLVEGVHSTLSFSPDGKYLYYSKITPSNKHKNNYSDLFRFDIEKEREERLTFGLRAQNPRLSPDGDKIVFVYGTDGTLNLGLCSKEGKDVKTLTDFKNGEQIFTPVWSPDGKKIAFGFSEHHNQFLSIIDTSGDNFKILIHEKDSRTPSFSSDGKSIYFAWDWNGIYNIYRYELENGTAYQMTNVAGGAFSPVVDDGKIVFSLFTKSGYTIVLSHTDSLFQKQINIFSSKPYTNMQQNTETIPSFVSKPYRSKFTTLSLIPFLRVDRYNERNKGIDVLKPGLYITSTEMLEHMSVFGGAAINRRLERDLFIIFEYNYRLPLFYQLGLAPTATIELYNITRSIDYSFELFIDRLERFTTRVDFNLFEFDLSLRHPISTKKFELEGRYTYSKYNQDFGSWLHPRPEFGVVKASRMTYLISSIISLNMRYDGIMPSVDKEINPVGRSFSLKYSYELNDYNPQDSSEIKNGFRVPVYTPYYFNRLEFLWRENIPLPVKDHVLAFTLRGGTILDKTVDDFFNFYVGGFTGMRGYPFYGIGGNEMLTLNVAYRFPISKQIDTRFLHFYFKKLYGVFFYDIGNAWNGNIPPLHNWKSDIGFELRLETYSWYVYPTRIFFSGAYGLKKFTKEIQLLTSVPVTYGHEWRFYLGVLFGFELSDVTRSLRLQKE